MRILIINEFVQLGGAEQIAYNQMQLFRNYGHEVKILAFNKGTAIEVNEKDYHVIPCVSKFNKLIFNPFFYKKIRNWIKEYNPERTIVHSLWSSPISQYSALKGYLAIQVIHDYYPVCPTSLCVRVNSDMGICKGYRGAHCLRTCRENESRIQLLIKRIYIKPYEKVRKKYIDLFVSPSEKLKSYLNEYGYNTICLNNPLDGIPGMCYAKTLSNDRKYIYIGGINTQKGIVEFVEHFLIFSRNRLVHLDIYGSITESKIENRFLKLVKLSEGKINFWGSISNKEARQKLKDADFMIMPSIWMENYPTSILESMAAGTVVIGSDRGGIPEMIGDGRGLIYDFDSKLELEKILSISYTMLQKEYDLIINNAFLYLKKHNCYDEYYKKLFWILGEI